MFDTQIFVVHSYTVVFSTQIFTIDWVRTSLVDHLCKVKKKMAGPRSEPWGTSTLIAYVLEDQPLSTVSRGLPVRKDFIIEKTTALINNAQSKIHIGETLLYFIHIHDQKEDVSSNTENGWYQEKIIFQPFSIRNKMKNELKLG